MRLYARFTNKLPKAFKQPLTLGLIAWFTLTWSWAFFTNTLSLAGSNKQGFLLAVLIVIVNVTLATIIMSWFFRWSQRQHRQASAWMIAGSSLLIFALADFLLAWLPALLWLGPQGRLDSVLPLNSPALLLVHTPFIFASRLIGFYGLAAFAWTVIYLTTQKKYRRLTIAPVLILAVLSVIGWNMYRTSDGDPFTARIISESLIERVPPVQSTGEKLILFPEYGFDDLPNTQARLLPPAEGKSYFISSQQVFRTEAVGHINRMVFGNTKDGITQLEDKYRLIPGGEDLPFILRTLLRATGQKSTLDYFSYAKAVIRGQEQLKPFVVDGELRIGAAVCSSIISPEDYRSFSQNGATIFTNSASLTTFKGSRLFAWQQRSLGKFMAVANARYFLQSANSASAYAFSSNGDLIGSIKGRNTLPVTVRTNSRRTLYTMVGETMVWAGAIVVAGTVFRDRRAAKRKR